MSNVQRVRVTLEVERHLPLALRLVGTPARIVVGWGGAHVQGLHATSSRLVGSISDHHGAPVPSTWQSAVQQAADPSSCLQLGGVWHGGVEPHVWMATP